ncbi:MAG: DMT family transporter [Acidimicrobiia bacterium]|nr:MAG: DMT family transporter [Acidimicrobiia bacterium]
MPLLLAGLSSLAFGVADFFGALATRRMAAVTVVIGSHVVALVAIFAAAPLFSEGSPGWGSLGWGAAGGVFGAAGLVVFYHALATTRVGVAAPAAAVVGTVVPVVFGLLIGERPGWAAALGMALAVPALILLPSGDGTAAVRATALRAGMLGGIAGLGFGLFGILISRTGDSSGVWPLAGARVASLALMALVALVAGRPLLPEGRSWGVVGAAGLLDIAANVLFLVAVRQELLSLVVVVMAFYPAVTIALARVFFGERTVAKQRLGLVLAAGSILMITLG